jgi:hypothetical protein
MSKVGRGRAQVARCRFSSDRKGDRPGDHLTCFEGTIQPDACTGYTALTREIGVSGRSAPRIQHAVRWTQARQKLFDEFESTTLLLAREALCRICEFYAMEAQIDGENTKRRVLVRPEQARSLLAAFEHYLQEQLLHLDNNDLTSMVPAFKGHREVIVRSLSDDLQRYSHLFHRQMLLALSRHTSARPESDKRLCGCSAKRLCRWDICPEPHPVSDIGSAPLQGEAMRSRQTR